MYKRIYELTKLILVSPAAFWKQLAASDDKKDMDVASGFVYPLLGIVALSAFVGTWWNQEVFNLPQALQLTCIDFVAGFTGFFIASFLIDEVSAAYLNLPKNIIRSRQFAGYSSIVIFMIAVILNIFPNFFFVHLFMFYIVYIVWEGSDVFMKVEEKDKLKFTIGASAVIIGSPMLILQLLSLLLPGI
ncbi:MAG: hypothetical protein FWF54_05735 [Candidatus Azobacteroides sp.]|nr:hypothetical protein [Candidatus Azobacteroides sp.]